MKHNKNAGKRKLKVLLVFAVSAVLILSLIIVNFFVPVKYIGAYLIFKKDKLPSETMRVRYLNVGYGDCTLIEFPDGKTMLIDGGTGTFQNVHMILKTLNSSGIDSIDYLVCTSVKGEHCGGLAEILKYKSVGTAYIPDVKNPNITDEYAEFEKQLSNNGAKTVISKYGVGVYSPEFEYGFFFLSPSAENSGGSEYDGMNSKPTLKNVNAASAVLWVEYGMNGFLFLGDADGDVQAKVAETAIAEGGKYYFDGMEFTFSDCAAVKVADHCSKGSVQELLYDWFQPSAAIISVGQNAQNCPSAEEIALLQLFCRDNVLRTDENGNLVITVSSGNLNIEKEF